MQQPMDILWVVSIVWEQKNPGTSVNFMALLISLIQEDKFLHRHQEDKDELLIAEFDLDMIEEVRSVWQFFRDRRPETYGKLVEL